jgi:hypothetical protein
MVDADGIAADPDGALVLACDPGATFTAALVEVRDGSGGPSGLSDCQGNRAA